MCAVVGALYLVCRAEAVAPASPVAAIRHAAAVYGTPYAEMIAVARCETGGTFNPRAYNRSSGASGLFQFLPSTWARTPFARRPIFSAWWNALAAAWLWLHDGRSWREWSCRP